MEAVWTRYFPLSIYIRSLITSGHLGPVHRVTADLSMATSPESTFPDDAHRMVNPGLAGGALLDLGIYSLTWCFQTLYLTQSEETRQKPEVLGAAVKRYHTGVDEQTTVLLNFPRSKELGGDAHAVATTSIRVAGDPGGEASAGPIVRVQGEKGEVQVLGFTARPTRTRVVMADGTVEDKEWKIPGPGEGSRWYNGFSGEMNPEGEGHGMFWEADEAGEAVLEGRKEGRFENLEESLVIMEVMDEIRRIGGVKYGEKIESTEYPLKLD